VLNVRRKKEKNGKNNLDKKKLREILNINRNKKNSLKRRELKWNKLRRVKVIHGNHHPPHKHRVLYVTQLQLVVVIVVIIAIWKKPLIIKLRSKLVVT